MSADTTDITDEGHPLDDQLDELYRGLHRDALSVDTMAALRSVRDDGGRSPGRSRVLLLVAPAVIATVALAGIVGIGLLDRDPAVNVVTDDGIDTDIDIEADSAPWLAEHGCGAPGVDDAAPSTDDEGEGAPARLLQKVESFQADGCRRTVITFEGDGAPTIGTPEGLYALDAAADRGRLIFLLPEGFWWVGAGDDDGMFDDRYGFAAVLADDAPTGGDVGEAGTDDPPMEEPLEGQPVEEESYGRRQLDHGDWVGFHFDDQIDDPVARASHGAEIVVDHGTPGTTSWTVLADPPRLVVDTVYADGEAPPDDAGLAKPGRTHIWSITKVPTEACCTVDLVFLGAHSEGSGFIELFDADGRRVEATWSDAVTEGIGYEIYPDRNVAHTYNVIAGANRSWGWSEVRISGLEPGEYRIDVDRGGNQFEPTSFRFTITD
ncbi:MAG: hypothetical protein AAGD35_02515 [Actinomycetota bacterium]